jgi:hypothetical protein
MPPAVNDQFVVFLGMNIPYIVMKILYVELYVSFLLGVFVYVLYEFTQLENEEGSSAEPQTGNARKAPSASFFPRGIISILVGLVAFCISAVVIGIVNTKTYNEPLNIGSCLAAGLFNPFFFIGVPLGIYRLNRSKRTST